MLLIHGDADEIVPITQSEDMQKALDKAGHKTELIRLKNAGHGLWSDDTAEYYLSAVGAFLWEQLGPGYGVDVPAVRLPPPRR